MNTKFGALPKHTRTRHSTTGTIQYRLTINHDHACRKLTFDACSITSPLYLMPALEQALAAPPKDALPEQTSATWNTDALTSRLGADVASAATAAALIVPVITIIDRSITQKASTGAAISSSIVSAAKAALAKPHVFVASRPFLIISSLYFSTYIAANTIDTLLSTVENKKASTVSAGVSKFAATSSVNMSLSVYKDSQFAKMFGRSGGAAAQIPRVTYALFVCRDSMTIFASFNLPTLIAPKLATLPPAFRSKVGRLLETESGRLNTAQFLTPAAMQLANTPLHLLGLDLFNRQKALGAKARISAVMKNWLTVSFARMGRIIPAFGVGGVVNSNVRSRLMSRIEG
ncbi:hypothetical protein MRB53_040122 [Persea americana]|nr:hypothetical protein MRB53_040122 [Persea americana]